MFWSVLYILATSESLSSHGARMWSMRSVFVSFVFLRILSLYARCFILLANPLCMRSQCLIVISHYKTNVGKMLNGECDRCVISRDTAITYLINGNDRLKMKEEKKRTEHESLQIIICIIRNGNCWQNSTSSNRNMAAIRQQLHGFYGWIVGDVAAGAIKTGIIQSIRWIRCTHLKVFSTR